MPTDKLIESVARIIFNTACGEENWNNVWWQEEQDGCMRAARAAILTTLTRTANMSRREIDQLIAEFE